MKLSKNLISYIERYWIEGYETDKELIEELEKRANTIKETKEVDGMLIAYDTIDGDFAFLIKDDKVINFLVGADLEDTIEEFKEGELTKEAYE